MKTDVAIVGGGPSGSFAAIHLARAGISSVIVEKVDFPRYHVGESMTGEAAALLRGLGLEERMTAAGHPTKHGVKVYGSTGISWFVPVKQRTPDGRLVEQCTWQVRRSVFDSLLLEQAARHATILPGKATRPLRADDGAVRGVAVRPQDGGELELEAQVVLDCSGQATFLAAHGVTGPKYLGAYDKQIAIFSQIAGFRRDTASNGALDRKPGNTLIFYRAKHHWAWAIPLDDEVVSVGLVVPARYFLDRKLNKQAFLEEELRTFSDELAGRLPSFEFVEDVHVVPNYSYQVAGFAGDGFLCVGDAHRFIDPIFSFGLFIGMKEAILAADATARYLEHGFGFDRCREHMVRCEQGLDALEDLVDTFWENPLAFAVMVHRRYPDQMIDLFANRCYPEDGQPSAALLGMRKLLGRTRMYDDAALYSVPIGSRFHPERAGLWDAGLDCVETTEGWMRDEHAVGSEKASRSA